MSACKEVKKWITQKVQVPVEEAITKAKRQCTEVKKKIEEKIRKPVEEWVSKQEKRCKERDCNWWCVCCNKWFCWFVTVVVKVVTWIVVTIIKWVTYLVCKIVMVIVDIIVKLVLRILKFLVTFLVCIFTDPLEALKSIWELWKDLLDIIEDIFDFIKSLVCDLIDLTNDIKRLTCALTSSLGWIGMVLIGLVDGVIHTGQQFIGAICDLLSGVRDILFGILNLNWCRITGGLTNIGTGIGHVIIDVIGIPGWVFVSGIAHNVRKKKLKEIIDTALNDAFGDDEERIERIKDEMRFYSCPMGLPVRLDARRMCIHSGEYLRELHTSGRINLFALAGQITDCGDRNWATQTASLLGEVVYTGTDIRVSFFDLQRFVNEGPDDGPQFTVYAIRLDRFEESLRIARTKGYQLGLEFHWDEILDYPIDSEFDPDFQFIPMDINAHDEVFSAFPRTGVDDPLCNVPTLAVFRYLNDNPSFGLTSWFRPPPYENPCQVPQDNIRPYIRKSGVSFTDRIPGFVFGTVLAHELGHYFGLCHEGHNGLEYIMYSPVQAVSNVTGNTFLEFLVLSGGPSYTSDDARRNLEVAHSGGKGFLFISQRNRVTMDQITIYDGAELKKLLEGPRRSIAGRIKLKIHGLDIQENQRYEKRINAWLQDCGCEMGAAFTFMALCLYLFVWWTGYGDMTVGRMLKVGLVVLFCAALVGKGFGIFLAKIRLRLAIRKLLR